MIGVSVLLQVAVGEIGFLNHVFGTTPLSTDQWLRCAAWRWPAPCWATGNCASRSRARPAGDLRPGLACVSAEPASRADGLDDLVSRRTGMRGVSGVGSDKSPDAALASEMFCRSVCKQIDAMAASVGGIDVQLLPWQEDAQIARYAWARSAIGARH